MQDNIPQMLYQSMRTAGYTALASVSLLIGGGCASPSGLELITSDPDRVTLELSFSSSRPDKQGESADSPFVYIDKSKVVVHEVPKKTLTKEQGESIVLNLEASTYFVKGDYDKAEQIYREAIAIAVENPYSHDGLGSVMVMKGNLEAALESYQNMLKYAHNDTVREIAHDEIGGVYECQGEYRKAIEEFEKILEIDAVWKKFNSPEDFRVHNQIGLNHLRLHEFEEALSHFDEAIALKPEWKIAQNNRSIAVAASSIIAGTSDPLNYTELGNFYGQNGIYDLALGALEKGLELSPKKSVKETNRIIAGSILQRQRRFDESTLEFLKVIELNPNSPKAYNAIGVNHVALREYEEAITFFDKALSFDPNLDTAIRNKEDTLKKMRKR